MTDLDEMSAVKTFLISVSPDPYYNYGKKDCLQEGSLQSLSDNSEHLSYGCYKYLISRGDATGNVQKIPFEWKTPKCGCFII